MDGTDYVFILIAYVVAAAIKGFTGIGFSTSCLPIMALHLDLKVAIPLVIIPSIISNIAVMIQVGHFRDAIGRFWPLYASSVPGLLIGLTVLVAIDADVAKAILGSVLIAYAVWALSNKPFSLSRERERTFKIPTGFLTGLINGITGSQVMPLLPFLLSLNLQKKPFVQAINISFTLSSLIMLFGLNQLGYFSTDILMAAVIGLIPVLIMIFFTARLQHRLTGALYRRLVLGFLLIMGLVLIIRIVF